MLTVQETTTKVLKTWDIVSPLKNIVFSVNNTELVNYYESETSITIFYGFLDQDYSDKCPAQFVAKLLNTHETLALNQLYGSFLVIHLNKNNQSYIIAADALGDFAVNYTVQNDSIHVSDLPSSLLTYKNTDINHQRILRYFAISNPQNNGSFFTNIKLLKPGHCLKIKQTKQEVSRYYFPNTTVNFKNRNLNELAGKFNALMQQVITYQTQGQNKVGIMMSGGMDSTFVAANCKKANKQVHTYSYVFPKMPKADESLWINSMRTKGYNMHTFVGESHWPLKSPWNVSINSPYNNPYRHLKSVIYQQAKVQEVKYVLTGVFADHLYTGYIYWLVDQIKHKPLSAIKSLYKTAKDKGVIQCLRQIAPSKFSKKTKLYSPWMNTCALSELKHLHNQNKTSHPHPEQFNLVYAISTAQSAYLENEHAFMHNVLTRHPFRDRRIVEFLTSLPAWVLGNIQNPKKFARYAAKDLLPKNIINRTAISTLEPLFHKGIYNKEFEKIKEILTDSSCQWDNYIKKDLMLNIINNPKNHFNESEHLVLWQCVNYELWRRRICAPSP